MRRGGGSLLFGVVGDVHGDFDALARVIASRPDAAFWLSVGDVASDHMRYPEPAAPFYWIQGNNEDFEFVAGLQAGGRGPRNLHLLPNGTVNRVHGIAVAALGGTFAPKWYETPAGDLPHPGFPGARRAVPSRPVRDDKRRHFVREQVDALKAQTGIEVLLTHEAPRPFFVQAGAKRLDAGKTAINELLSAIKPRLHFFGHHHRFSEAIRQGVPSIGLPMVSESFVVVEAESLAWQKLESPKA